MLYVLIHTGALIAILLLLGAAGVLWDAFVFRGPSDPGERALVFIVSAFSTWIAIAFSLCALHALTRPVAAVIAGIVLSAALAILLKRRGTLRLWSDRDAVIVLIPISGVVAALYLVALCPLPGWDAEVYHLTIPRLYVAAGGFRTIPFNIYSKWPLNGELLFGLVLLFSDHVSAALVHYAAGLATCAVLFIGSRWSGVRWPGWAGALATAFFLINPIVQYEMTVAYVDLFSVLFLATAFLSIERALTASVGQRLWLVIAGVSAGMLAGTKPTGILSVAALALWAAFRAATTPSTRPPFREWVLSAIIPAGLLAVIWPLRAWIRTGNPAYPFLYDNLGGPEWSGSLSTRLLEWQGSIGMGRTWQDYLLLPIRVILDGGHSYAHFYGELSHFWIGLLPLAIILSWPNVLARRCLGFAGILFVTWALSSQQVRFLIPAVCLICLGTGIALVDAVERHFSTRASVILPAMGAAAGLLLLISNKGTFESAEEWSAAYWRKDLKLPKSAIKPIYSFINAKLPPDARLLLINTNFTFFIEREAIADSFFEASQIAEWLAPSSSPAEIRAQLHDQGVTHLLVSHAPPGVAYPKALSEMIADRQGLVLVFSDAKYGYDLYFVCRETICSAQETGTRPQGL